MVRVGMIGCGGMGNHHAGELAKLANVEVVGTCDLIEEKAKDVAAKAGTGRYCTDYRELLPDVDAAWICTEPFNRVELVTEAAKAGKHVFTEKPVALTLADADAMIEATSAEGVIYMLGYVLRFTQPYRLLHDTFASGQLGGLVSCWMKRFMPWNPARWYGRQEMSGGVSLDFGSHDVDWLRWIGGNVKTVFGTVARVREGIEADDHGAAMFRFEKGGVGTVENSWSSYMRESTFGIIGTKGAMFVGSDGAVRKQIGHDGAEELIDIESALTFDSTGAVDGAESHGNGDSRNAAAQTETIQEHFFRCIEEGAVPLTSAREGRETLRTVQALWEAAKTGGSVEVADMERRQ